MVMPQTNLFKPIVFHFFQSVASSSYLVHLQNPHRISWFYRYPSQTHLALLQRCSKTSTSLLSPFSFFPKGLSWPFHGLPTMCPNTFVSTTSLQNSIIMCSFLFHTPHHSALRVVFPLNCLCFTWHALWALN